LKKHGERGRAAVVVKSPPYWVLYGLREWA